jgi:hypothetical protein
MLLAVVAAGALHVYLRRYTGPLAIQRYFTQSLPRELAEFWRPGAGEWVLAKPVQQALLMLRSHEAKSFRMSPEFKADPEYPQRLMEGGWPIRLEAGAAWYVAFAGEQLPAGCSLVEKQEDALLARCPQP